MADMTEWMEKLDKPLLDELYGFAYRRCRSAQDAEELCSQIVLVLLTALHRQEEITHFHGLVWTVARRVYADYCEKRRHEGERRTPEDSLEKVSTDPIDEYVQADADAQAIRQILRQIAFLSKSYRDVMVLYYLDGCRTADIARRLGISESIYE